MGGNVGLLQSLTCISGRGPCWPAAPPLVGPTSVHILVGTRRCIGALPNSTRVHHSPTSVPDVVARTTPAATPDHGSRVRRLPSSPGPVGSSPGFLHTKWSGEETSQCHRAHDCTGVPGSRGVCLTERFPP